MLISLVIPVYNSMVYLADCLDSVVCQEDGIEIILVDDGSTDSSYEVCEQYRKQHPEHIKLIHQENRGRFDARRAGIAVSSGEYLMFMDADDVLHFDAIEVVRKYLDETNPDILVFGFTTSLQFNDLKSGLTTEKSKEVDSEVFRETLLVSEDMNSLWNKAFRRECLVPEVLAGDRLRFNYGEDKAMCLVAADGARTVRTIDSVLYGYRRHNASITVRSSAPFYRDAAILSGFEERYMRRWGMEACAGRAYARIVDALLIQMQRYLTSNIPLEKKIEAIEDMHRDPRMSQFVGGGISPISREAEGWGCMLLPLVAGLRCLHGRTHMPLES